MRGKLLESSSCILSDCSSYRHKLSSSFPSKMHKIRCMHFTHMFAYTLLMKQLNFPSILWIFLFVRNNLIWASALWVKLNSLERGRKERKERPPREVRGSLRERTDLYQFRLSHLPAPARKFGAAPSPASLTESQPNKTEISSFTAAAAR